MWRELKKKIQENQNFIITTHVNPDGDGVGAGFALLELLRKQGKKVRIVTSDPIPKRFDFLNKYDSVEIFSSNQSYLETEVLIVLDTHTLERIGSLQKLVAQEEIFTVCIDHHPLTRSFVDMLILDDNACSVGSMIYTLFKESGIPLNHNAASGIYTSVISDTGRFCYSSTGRRAHKIADECLKIGVDPSYIYSQLFQQVPLEEMRLFMQIMQNVEYHLNEQVILQPIPYASYAHLENNFSDFEFIHEFHKLHELVECVVVICELPDRNVRFSARSKYRVDVGSIMKELGGGGHCKAAGGFYKGSLEKSKREILKYLQCAFSKEICVY